MRVPPRLVRRLVLAPAVVVLAVILVWALPVVLLVMLAVSLIPKVGRVTRILSVLVFYVNLDGAGLVVLFAL